MKKFWITLAACFGLASTAEVMACTGLLVGKKASVDGSVMISYAADSYTLYGVTAIMKYFSTISAI